MAEQRVLVDAVMRIDGDAARGCHSRPAEFLGNVPPDTFGRLDTVGHVGLRHQDDKFLSPPTGDKIASANRAFDDLRRQLQNAVAGGVSVVVVDALEVIEIE